MIYHPRPWLLALLLAVSALPAVGQMAATSDGKFLGNILEATATPDASFDTYWNQVTPENSGKWDAVEATRDVMIWSHLDFMYAYTRARGIPFKQHTFVWGQQSPAWITTLTQAEQREEVEEWIAAYGTRYPNTEFIDVVNEPLHAPAEYRAALGGAGTTGWDWVIWSFEKARLHCPNAKLLLNDYNIINSDSATTQYLAIINLLKDRGLIDGIGEQAHFFESSSITTIQNNLNRLAATGLPIYISELDINLANDTAQLNRYQTLFPVFWTNPAVRGITFWGYKQGQIWQSNAYLLKTNGTERPALTWLKDYIAENTQTLSVSITAPADGQDFAADLLVSASATVTYGTAPFTVTFQQKLIADTEFTTVGSDNTPPCTAELGVLPVGTYQIRAIVTDNVSATAASATHTFTVSPGPIVRSWDGGTTDIVGTGDGASDGGDGTWDTTIQNWDQGNGLAQVAWDNTTNDTAIFGGTAGTISLGTGITVGGLTFASAYAVNNNTVTFGAAGTISNSASVTIDSALAGTDPITKAGAGTLTLSGSNNYTGTTVISNGVLAISHNTALGNTSGNTTITATGFSAGPQLSISGNIDSAENISISGRTDQNNYAPVILNTSGTNTLSGTITLANPTGVIRIASTGGELTFGGTINQTGTARTLTLQTFGSGGITVSNAIANTGGQLTILGGLGSGPANGVTLNAASTVIGNTTIEENGLLKLGVTNAIKTTGTLTIGVAQNFVGNGTFDYGTFDLAGFNQTVSALIGTKNSGNTIGADSNRIVTNSVTGTSTLTVGNSNGTGIFNGVILDGAGAVAITKIGTGTQTLVGDSNYSGVTTISAGTLAIIHSNALGSTAGNTTIAATGNTSGGTLNLSNINSAENITITGATEQNSYMSAILSTGGTNTLSGNITLASPTGGIRLGASSGSLTFSGNISQTGTTQGLAFNASGGTITVNNPIANNGGPLSVYASSTVTLKGVNGVGGIGNTNIAQGGTIKLGVSEALNTTGNLTIGTAVGQQVGTLDLAGFNQTVNALNGVADGANTQRKVTNSAAGNGTNTLTVGNGDGTGTFNGVIVDGATAKIALVKTGSGTQTLADVNTYSGDTTVNGGTLTFNNANANNETSTVTIAASGATLKLTYAGTDTVDKLFIGASQLAAGEYGNSSSVLPIIARSEITGTGTLTVTTGPGGGSTYAAWQTANSTAQTINQDHDNDGVSNGAEYFLGGNTPTTGFTPLPGVIDTAGTLSVTWTKAASYTGTYGGGFVVETSATLAGEWTTETPGVNVTFPTATEVKYTFPAGTRNFARLKVTGP